ncbi:hypothetical protein F939_00888 [Acinetobacter radioresistens DSM 6976 = NBRC 102413 = CIP 103788]|uniref:PilC/PilY family type IV pilus protein n=2 Tax=Acinetobacter radioresistens TaxID=40216 RepID=UPI00028EFD51|nr:PilC/PilY family type IV pilus protein [Acinetobacter radioresistens]ENV90196.1 hypothetical protein F939_00888 [Acinetobacter radioresistens DSM 6976 = NBRC 102413 = CIP 103788]MCU4516415.1 pilus assembly protein PilC [Acinetobacter radioresistens]BBL21856.1 pilus assembly protein PilY [Acinetobacter radioresistens DSM 6976 = NBRC 102413 = CIP 103788]
MKIKFKKSIVTAWAAGLTSLVCGAVSASDIELYKPAQTSKTTLMFMLDVSGSMAYCDNRASTDYKCQSGDVSRLDYLKTGMKDLLNGNPAKNIQKLDDNLYVGLGVFSGTASNNDGTGRIQIGAKRLGDIYTYTSELDKEVFKTVDKRSRICYVFGCLDWNRWSQDSKQECDNWDDKGICKSWKNYSKTIEGTSYSISEEQTECSFSIINCLQEKRTTVYFLKSSASGSVKETHRSRLLKIIDNINAHGGTPTAFAYAEAGAYMLGETTAGVDNSGYNAAVSDVKNSGKYKAPETMPTASIDTSQCSGYGIYFLTDGVPEYGKNASSLNIMKKSLGTNGSSFSCSTASLGGRGSYYNSENNTNNWTCIGEYTKALLDPEKNPLKVSIKTAVVGFGSTMDQATPTGNTKNDILDAQAWGALGKGGFYRGSDSASVVNSVNQFLQVLATNIPSVTTGTATIPVDNLDTQMIQPWVYFPQFDPQPASTAVSWMGNVKKFSSETGVLKDRDNKAVMSKEGILADDVYDFWADPAIIKEITKGSGANAETIRVKLGGTLSKVKLGRTISPFVERKIYTDRAKITISGAESSATTVKKGDLNLLVAKDLYESNATNNFVQDKKRGYLAALFGFDISKTMASALTISTSDTPHTNFKNFITNQNNAKLRQMGAVMHSKPLLITQSGTTSYTAATDTLTYTNRDDLIVFGSTAGLLHVVKAGNNENGYSGGAGEEIFVFAPSELIDKQPQAFLNNKEQAGELHYGIDGPWTAYTEYVTTGTGINPKVTVQGGKQWIYGGLRMGGRSYYALDLSDVTSSGGTPKIKFKIDPSALDAPVALTHMGESWSKPLITWVNWQGKRKLVMVVGGGYDRSYESPDYASEPSKGAGVYIFDADNGKLLWWASKHANNTATESKVDDLKYSVVSQIKAVDRNNDGLTDHFYFGDLGGQLWRIDWGNLSTTGVSGETARVTRLLNLNDGKNSPRFYTTPTFTIHNTVNDKLAVITIGSGDFSSPMSAGVNPNDAVYVIFDKDVTKRNLPVLKPDQLKTRNLVLTDLVKNNKTDSVGIDKNGWYYPLPSKSRILNDHIAIDNDLYVSIFNANEDIDNKSCTGGIRGKSTAQLFCLPYGGKQCFTGKSPDGKDIEYDSEFDLGRGNVGINLGGLKRNRSIILNTVNNLKLKGYQGKTQFISQRWYER